MGFEKLKIINLTQLAKQSNVSYTKIYFRKHGWVKAEMTLPDRTRIVNAIKAEIMPLFEELGFGIDIKPMKK